MRLGMSSEWNFRVEPRAVKTSMSEAFPVPHASALLTQVIAFIGGGQMASALMGGLLRAGGNPHNVIVVDPDEAQRSRLAQQLHVRVAPGVDAMLSEADVVVWAVKPQVFAAAASPLQDVLTSPLHISIVAGVPTEHLALRLGSERIVRAMPNTPSLVGAGVTAMLAMPGLAPEDRRLAEALLSATARTFWVDSDERIDAVTAVSGSGPGFVFQFLEHCQTAAQELGFTEAQARELVLRTAAGAVALASAGETPFGDLRERVTSKGGTTEAGARILNQYELGNAVSLAMRAAYERARALSQPD